MALLYQQRDFSAKTTLKKLQISHENRNSRQFFSVSRFFIVPLHTKKAPYII